MHRLRYAPFAPLFVPMRKQKRRWPARSRRWNRRRGSAGPTGGALQPRWPGVERRRQGGLAAPLLSRTAALDRRGLGEQTSGMDGCLVRERGKVTSSWHRYPGEADHLFEEHELRIVLARRMLGRGPERTWAATIAAFAALPEIGRASCREGWWQYV